MSDLVRLLGQLPGRIPVKTVTRLLTEAVGVWSRHAVGDAHGHQQAGPHEELATVEQATRTKAGISESYRWVTCSPVSRLGIRGPVEVLHAHHADAAGLLPSRASVRSLERYVPPESTRSPGTSPNATRRPAEGLAPPRSTIGGFWTHLGDTPTCSTWSSRSHVPNVPQPVTRP